MFYPQFPKLLTFLHSRVAGCSQEEEEGDGRYSQHHVSEEVVDMATGSWGDRSYWEKEGVMGRIREQDMPLKPGQILAAEPPYVLVSAARHPSARCWGTLGVQGGNHSPVVDGPAWELDSLPGRKKGQGESLQLSQVLHRLRNHLSIFVINKSMHCTAVALD